MFRAVADSGSISQASKHVFQSQPAITQSTAKLEGIVDTALFERPQRRHGPISRPIGLTLRDDWHPTVAQRVFLDHLREAATPI